MESSSATSSSRGSTDPGEMIRSANMEIDAHLRSLAEQEAALLHRQNQLKKLVTNMTERHKQFTSYTDDLRKKKQNLDKEMQQSVEEFGEMNAKIDREIDTMSKTLANLQHENALLTDRRTTSESSISESKRKIEDMERKEESLRERKGKLKEKIAECERAAPKRTPEKLKNEIALLNNNIYLAKRQVKDMEDSAVNLELKVISCKTDMALLAQSEARIREERTKLLARDEVQMGAQRKQLDVQIEMQSVLEARQLETNAYIERVREVVADWKALDSDKKARIRRMIERMEQLRDSIQDTKRELVTLLGCAQNTDDLREQIDMKRKKFEMEKSSEFTVLRQKNRRIQRRIGQMILCKDEADEEVESLCDLITEMDGSIKEEDERTKELAERNKEVDAMTESHEKEVQEEREKVEKDVQLLDSLQRQIAFAKQDEKDMRVESMRLIQPALVSQPSTAGYDVKKLKKTLKSELDAVENLGFQLASLRAQLETRKREAQVLKSNVDYSSLVYRKIKRESNTVIEANSLEQKMKLNRMQQENTQLNLRVERKQQKINNRKRELQTKLKHIRGVEDEQRIQSFGENVALHVDRFSKDPNQYNKSERKLVSADTVLAVEKLDWLLRKINIEKSIWCEYAKPATYLSQLDAWNEQLTTMTDK